MVYFLNFVIFILFIVLYFISETFCLGIQKDILNKIKIVENTNGDIYLNQDFQKEVNFWDNFIKWRENIFSFNFIKKC